MRTTHAAVTLTERDKADVRMRAHCWQGSVARGDCTAEYAAETIAGHVTQPYAPAWRFEECRLMALSLLNKHRPTAWDKAVG